MTEPDLLPSEIEEDLRTSLSDLLSRRLEHSVLAAMYDGDRGVIAGLWRSVAVDLGLAGLLVPEPLGGSGASAREAAVALEDELTTDTMAGALNALLRDGPRLARMAASAHAAGTPDAAAKLAALVEATAR